MTTSAETRAPLVSVIVPTYNSASGLERLLASLQRSEYRRFEIIVNDDMRTSDPAKAVVASFRAQGLPVVYARDNRSRAQGRRSAARMATGTILLHLDSDMEVTPGLLGECAARLSGSCDALVIPERSVGTSFWARCRSLERQCYDQVDEIESLRCLTVSLYEDVDGHNEAMVFAEDKDLDLRVRRTGARVGRTRSQILHHEGEPSLRDLVRKRMYYVRTAAVFAREHPREFRHQVNPFVRGGLYLRRADLLARDPLTYAGMLFMKMCEALFSLPVYIFGRRAVPESTLHVGRRRGAGHC
jgi:glycosyltransferase involved in cell wall biosynthesis